MSFSGSSKRLRQCKKRRMQISKTISGKECQKWSEQKPHKHKYAFVGDHNFCRNPKNGHTGVWCYTASRKKRWEDCAVPKCKLGAAICFENCDIGVDLSFDYAILETLRHMGIYNVETNFLQVNPAIGSALERQMGLHAKRVAEHQTVDRFFDRNNFQFP